MNYDYDVLCIGLGPAGMAVSVMASAMDLKVCAIERRKIGGECMNVGCIPSKALLRIAHNRQICRNLGGDPASLPHPALREPFQRVRDHIDYIGEKKTRGMFEKVEVVMDPAGASLEGPHEVRIGGAQGRLVTARRIFLAVGTRPAVPEVPGLTECPVLTNENMFDLERLPEKLAVIGGGAIACEMAQAFARLGSQVTMIIRGDRLLRQTADHDASRILEERFEREGITILRNTQLRNARKTTNGALLTTDQGSSLEVSAILAATGRRQDFTGLGLEKAGITFSAEKGIEVNRYLQTSCPSIYALGDCNGHALFSHSAMHQGMLALMNSMMPWPLKRNFRNYVVPWTVFTDPQVSHVGPTEDALRRQGAEPRTVAVNYGDYGAAIAEEIPEGFVRVWVTGTGKILAATVVGEGSSNMINEWALAIQKGLRLSDILMLQHSFPGMGFLNKRVAETWMMKLMEGSSLMRKIASGCYRLVSK